jgi:drug/metabolite transporter (DMT)-like permease
MQPSIPALAAGLGAAAIWGGMYAVSKLVLEVVPPFALLSLRLLLGFAVLAAFVLARGGFRLPVRRASAAVAVGAVGYGLSLGFQFVGTKLSTASNGALVTSATPVLVLVFARLILGERIGARRLAAVALACAGVLAVLAPWAGPAPAAIDGSPHDPTHLVGNICLLAAALSWALYSVLVRRLAVSGPARAADSPASDAVSVASLSAHAAAPAPAAADPGPGTLEPTALMLLGGLPSSLILGARELATVGIGPITPPIVAGILFLGVVSTAAAMFLWNYAFAKLPAATASLTFFAQPVVGVLLGWAFLGEAITPLFLAGGALIGAGILLSNREPLR